VSLPDDNERTLIKGAASGSPAAPADVGPWDEHADALPAGTRLHEFEILSVIGQGGFGIVYLAHDQALDRQVAIKEYMPSSMAVRTREQTVAVRSARDKDTFAAGLRSFINEAKLLARFDHASLLKVHQFWEAQGTAYMVMPKKGAAPMKRSCVLCCCRCWTHWPRCTRPTAFTATSRPTTS
jgi:serine/threonine protein kinase